MKTVNDFQYSILKILKFNSLNFTTILLQFLNSTFTPRETKAGDIDALLAKHGAVYFKAQNMNTYSQREIKERSENGKGRRKRGLKL